MGTIELFAIIRWPFSQDLYDKKGFKENCKLVLNENTPTYAARLKWLKEVGLERLING